MTNLWNSDCPCRSGQWRAAVRADNDRYVAVAERDGYGGRWIRAQVSLAFKTWAVMAYRAAHHARTRPRPGPSTRLLAAVALLAQRLLTAVTSIEIDPMAHIGPGLFLPHSGYLVLGPVHLGRHCTVSQGVTLGQGLTSTTGESGDTGTPTIGDRVWIGPGCVVAGPLSVGDDAALGANAVVTRDVPPRGVVFGVPARLVSREGSRAQVYYRDMAEDPARTAAYASSPSGA